ncbi:MAG: glycosyltransferase [Thermoflavifilum sp.]|nr:glycosyltransferase [Thermoflavifilum sp.]
MKSFNEVYVVSHDSGYRKLIEQSGFIFLPVAVKRGKGDVWHNGLFFCQLMYLYHRYRPDMVLHISLKIIVFGSFAAFFFPHMRVWNYFSGLGHVFLLPETHGLRKLISVLLKFIGLRKGNEYLFETCDDQQLIYRIIGGAFDRFRVLGGLGVSLEEYRFAFRKPDRPLVLLFPARILSTKGLFELHQLAITYRKEWNGKIRFQIAGKIDPYNPAYIHPSRLKQLLIPGYVEWMGYVEDMPTCYREAHVVILLSYREGVPRVLMEACASGKPILTFRVPGCQECVKDGVNGYLIPFGDLCALHEKINLLYENPHLLQAMALASRKLAEEKFDIRDAVARWKSLWEKQFANL